MDDQLNDLQGLVYVDPETGEQFGPIRAVQAYPAEHPTASLGCKAFAEDSCDNAFVISNDGRVLFWDHETEGLTVLANVLEEFVVNCHVPKPIALDKSQVKRAWINPDFAKKHRPKT